MSFSDFFAKVKRYDKNATVIFDRAEPIGRATDLVLPDRRWLESPASRLRAALRRRRACRKAARRIESAPKRS
jgi:hypothetical protein